MSIFPDIDFAIGQTGALGFFNNIRKRLRNKFYSTDYNNLQLAINATKNQMINGGVLYIPSGIYTIDEPLILPRTDTSPQNVVKLIGQGRYHTIIKGSNNFPQNRALIEWENTPSRAWEQHIENIGFHLPDIEGVRAIHYRLTNNSSYEAIFNERSQINLINLYIIANNDYHKNLIKLEGINNFCVINNIFGDPQQGINGTYDTLLLEADSSFEGFLQGSDAPGLYACSLSNLYSTTRRGGYSSVFKGRLCRSKMTDCFGNGGKNKPSFNFINSICNTLDNLSTEGQSEKPQYLFENCSDIRAYNIGIGTPDEIDNNSVGNGIELIDCNDCKFFSRWSDGTKPAFSSKGVKVIYINENSNRNNFYDWKIRSSGIPENEFEIFGNTNTINYIDFETNTIGTIIGM